MAEGPHRNDENAVRLLIQWGVALTRVLGIAGVADHESWVAQRWGRRLEVPLLFITLWIPIEWYLVHTGHLTVSEGFGIDLILWGFFLVEQLILLALVKDRLYYVKTNWLLVGVVAFGLPLLLIQGVNFLLGVRLLRGLLVLITALRLGRRYFRELGRHVFFAIALMTAFLVVLGGAIMPILDPDSFTGFGDAVWWTLVTLSTVGYGDIVPQTESARLMGLIFVAIAVFWMSLISASIAAFLVGLRIETSTEDEERFETQIMRRLDRIEALLENERAARQDLERSGSDSRTHHEPPGR